MICRECGKECTKLYVGMCQGCYNYFHNGGIVHPLPKSGEIKYDDKGKVICHICGRSYNRLGSHIKESHNMTIAEYKKEFGLCNNATTTEKAYHDKMRKLAYENNMSERLMNAGKDTRIQKGEKSKRLGKHSRKQEVLERQTRLIEFYKNKRKEEQ